MKQIDSLELILRGLLSKIMLLTESDSQGTLFSVTNECLKTEANIDLFEILETPDDLLIDLLKTKELTPSNLNDIIHILFYLAKNNREAVDGYNAGELYRKAKFIANHLNMDMNIAYFNTENLFGRSTPL